MLDAIRLERDGVVGRKDVMIDEVPELRREPHEGGRFHVSTRFTECELFQCMNNSSLLISSGKADAVNRCAYHTRSRARARSGALDEAPAEALNKTSLGDQIEVSTLP